MRKVSVPRTFVRRGVSLAVMLGALAAADAASQAPPPRPKPKPAPAAPPAAKPAARTATLVIESDLPCMLTVNGEDLGPLPANGTKTLTVPVGEQVVRAISEEAKDVVWRKAIDVTAGQRKAVLIELKPLLVDHRAAEAKRQAEAEAASVEQLTRYLEGIWEEESEGKGKFTGTEGGDYTAKYFASLVIQRTREGLSGKLMDRRAITPATGAPFTRTYEVDMWREHKSLQRSRRSVM
jgi:hypothetical protein